ncbi:MAG TPA: hypothetical protein VLS49_11400 [Usitatibacter sp.]|nr:hypothetical protein [Usitatibacter sp.]
MRPYLRWLANALLAGIAVAMLAHGPIAQLEHYHEFADTRGLFGIANASDVLSNAGFAVVALWGLIALWPHRREQALERGWPGHALFLAALFLTALGSSFYHLAPDNDRLLWDRIPIALACAGLLAAVHAETHEGRAAARRARSGSPSPSRSRCTWRPRRPSSATIASSRPSAS